MVRSLSLTRFPTKTMSKFLNNKLKTNKENKEFEFLSFKILVF